MVHFSGTDNEDDGCYSKKDDLSSLGLANVMDSILKKQSSSSKHIILAKTLTDKQIAHKRKIKETDEGSRKENVEEQGGQTDSSEKVTHSLTEFQKLQQERIKVCNLHPSLVKFTHKNVCS